MRDDLAEKDSMWDLSRQESQGSFRMDQLDLLAAQGTLKSLLQHHSSKVTILQHLAFFSPALTSIHDYWKNHSFDQMNFVGKVMSLLFNMLSRLVIVFLPRSKCLSILWLQPPSSVILEPKKIKSVTIPICFYILPIYTWHCSPWGCKELDMTKQLNNNNEGLEGWIIFAFPHGGTL